MRRVSQQLEESRPEAAKVTVFVPRAKPMTVKLKVFPNTKVVRTAVTAEIKDLIVREAGVGTAFETDGTIYLSKLREAIAEAEGEHHHELIEPTADIVPGRFEIITLGGIVWLD